MRVTRIDASDVPDPERITVRGEEPTEWIRGEPWNADP